MKKIKNLLLAIGISLFIAVLMIVIILLFYYYFIQSIFVMIAIWLTFFIILIYRHLND